MANWYAYDGYGNPTLPGSYIRMFNKKPNCISGGCKICAIYLPETSSPPGSIVSISGYLGDALATGSSQPANGFKRFVYVRDC